jgi:hypothetical protein
MNFCEAMDLLKNGAKVTRSVWKGSLYFMMQGDVVMSYQPRYLDYTYDESIMVSDGWLIEGDTQEYTFCKIIPFLNDGKKAHMADWKDSFIFLDKPTGKLVLHMMDSFPFVPEFESFTATDWIEE